MTMSHRIQVHERNSATTQSGVATLELVMCMPVVLLLLVSIVWLGFSVVGKSAVTTRARHQAWAKRFDADGRDALRFLPDEQFATEEAKTEIRVSPLLNDVAPPESKHDVAFGSWDHSTLELDRAPHWQHYLVAAANAKTGGLQVAYTDARNDLRKFQEFASNAVQSEIEDVFREFLKNPLSNVSDLGRSGQNDADSKAAQEKQRIEQQIHQKQAELRDAEKTVKELKTRQRENNDATLDKSLDNRVKVAENKVLRLKAQLSLLRESKTYQD